MPTDRTKQTTELDDYQIRQTVRRTWVLTVALLGVFVSGTALLLHNAPRLTPPVDPPYQPVDWLKLELEGARIDMPGLYRTYPLAFGKGQRQVMGQIWKLPLQHDVGMFGIAYADYDTPIVDPLRKLHELAKDFAREPLELKRTTLAGEFPGLEVHRFRRTTNGSVHHLFRLFAVGRRVYLLDWKGSRIESDEVRMTIRHFFDSFQVVTAASE